MPPLILHLLRRTGRSLWEHLSLNLMATGVVCATILLVGVFLTVLHNLDAITSTWEQDVHLSAWFQPEVSLERRLALQEEVRAMPEVEEVRYVSEEEARAWLEARVPEVEPVLAELGSDVLPASLEVTLRPGSARGEAVQAVAARLALPEFSELDHGHQWVARFNTFLSLLRLLGMLLGGLVCVAGVFLVANTIHLVVFSRRDELETMRLVVATDLIITVPFLLEGLLQGLVGAGLALGILAGVHRWVADRLDAALDLGLVGEQLVALPLPHAAALVATGAALGCLGSWTAVARFLRSVP